MKVVTPHVSIQKCPKRFGTPDSWLSKLYRSYGRIVARNPLPFVLLPIACIVGLSSGVIFFESTVANNDPEYLYAPTDAPAFHERDIINDHWPLDPEDYIPGRTFNTRRTAQAIIRLRNGGNLLDNNITNDIVQLNKWIIEKMQIQVEEPLNVTENIAVADEQKTLNNYTYLDLCMRWHGSCSFRNEHVDLVDFLLHREEKFGRRLTFPRASFSDASPPVYLAAGLGGVTFDPNTTLLSDVKAIFLIYYLRSDGKYSLLNELWEKEFVKHMESLVRNKSSPFDVAYFYSQSLASGLSENADSLKPRFAVTFGVLFLVAILCTFKSKIVDGRLTIDTVNSKPLLGLVGALNPALAVFAAKGFLIYCGVTYNTIVEVMPFLVMSIGLDDMFIMVSAWRSTDPSKSVEDRMSDTLGEAAVSITITTISNALSFAFNMQTNLNAVFIFSAYTTLAVLLDFVFQLTFFAGIMVYCGRLEVSGKNSIVCCINNKGKKPHTEERDLVRSFFTQIYRPALDYPIVKMLAVLFMIIYLSFGIWGCLNLRQGLKQQNLILRSHHAYAFYDWSMEYFWPRGVQAEVVVNNVPDLSYYENRTIMEEIVQSFEGTQYTMDSSATDFWLREYRKYLKEFSVERNTTQQWTRNLFEWSQLSSNIKTFSQDFFWRNATDEERESCHCKKVIEAFRFRIGYKNFETTNNQRETLFLMRRTAAMWSEYNVTTYMNEYPFMDQYSMILSTTLSNVAQEMATMIVVVLVLIPNFLCVFWITATIVSIDIGVVGYMTWWGVSLDAISMITIIMSIGFSVDHSAHISYGYMAAKGSPNDRAVAALQDLGWPVLQGAFSTLIGVCVLSTVDSYMVQTFFKTVFLVMIFGMMHALFLLPIMLTITDTVYQHILTVIKSALKKRKKGLNAVQAHKEMRDGCTKHEIGIEKTENINDKLANGFRHPDYQEPAITKSNLYIAESQNQPPKEIIVQQKPLAEGASYISHVPVEGSNDVTEVENVTSKYSF